MDFSYTKQGLIDASLKPLAKCEPAPLPEFDEPDILLSSGPSEEWTQCDTCFKEIRPRDNCVADYVKRKAWCTECWPIR